MKFVIILLSVGLTVSTLLNVYLFQKKQQPLIPTYQVIGVVDGDSFLIEGKREIRLRHTKAAELGLCGSQEAKDELKKLINSKRITLTNQIPDVWGRQMAMVFEGDNNINKIMIARGLVRYYHDVTPFKDELKKAGDDAQANLLGIFAKCESLTPPDPKCVIKANIRTERKTNKYYLPNCPQYPFTKVSQDLGEKWYCSEKEAKSAGFTKAENCP